MKTRAALPALLLAATAALTACGSGSDDQDEPELATGVMEGMEHGWAKGSEVEVPLDESVLATGTQAELTTPANVLEDSSHGKSVITLTPVSVVEGDMTTFEFEGQSADDAAGARVYYVSYRADYLNGAVQTGYAPNRWELFADDRMISTWEAFGTTSSECHNSYQVADFGEGAWIEGCTALLVGKDDPAPTALVWLTDSDSDVSWPLS